MKWRNEIIRHVDQTAGDVVIDFGGVRTFTEGAADELIGVLVYLKGAPWFKRHIQCLRLDDDTRNLILATVQLRLDVEAKRTLK